MLQALRSTPEKTARETRRALWMAAMALGAHITYLLWLAGTFSAASDNVLNFNLSSMALVVSALIMLIFLLGCVGMNIARLGIMMFPLTALSLLFSLFWESTAALPQGRPLFPLSAFSAHVMISILAYSMLTIATVQSLLYLYQERQFKNHATPASLSSLPPLQSMEQLLFRLLWIGFALLTLTLLSGGLFSQTIFGQPFEFNHKTVLAILGWCVFGLLLLQRASSGLRGAQATIWTVAGFTLIHLGYFGTKFIKESLQL